MSRGRPVKSKTREKMTALLYYYKELYGYDIYKKYKHTFGKVSLRLIYYHLDKGIKENLFIKNKTEIAKGKYSWGSDTKRIYYSLNKDVKIDTRHIIKIKNKDPQTP